MTNSLSTEFLTVYGDALPAPPVGDAWAIAGDAKLVVGTNGTDIIAWEIESSEEAARAAFETPLDKSPVDAIVSPDGTIFGARTSTYDAWQLWDRSTTPPTPLDEKLGGEGDAEIDRSNRWIVYQDSDESSLKAVDLTGRVEPRTFEFGKFERLDGQHALFAPRGEGERPLPPVAVDLATGEANTFPAAPSDQFWYGAVIDASRAVVLGIDAEGGTFIARFVTVAGDVLSEHRFAVPDSERPVEIDHEYNSTFWAEVENDSVKMLAGEQFHYFSLDGQPKPSDLADGVDELREYPGAFVTRFRGGGPGFHAFSMLDMEFEPLPGNELGIVYADGSTRILRLTENSSPVLATEVSVDRKHLVVVRRDSTVEIWTTSEPRIIDTFRLDEVDGWDWAGHVDRSETPISIRMAGTEVRFGIAEIGTDYRHRGASVFRRDVATGRTASKQVPLANVDEEVLAIWLAGGKVVASGEEPNLFLIDIATGERTGLPEDGFVNMAFVDGDWIHWTLKSFYLDHLVATGQLSGGGVPILQGWHPSGQHWILPFGDLGGDSLITQSANGRYLVLKQGPREKPEGVVLRDRSTGNEHVLFGKEYAPTLMFGTKAHFLANGLLVSRWAGEAYFSLFDSKPPHESLGSFKVTNAAGRLESGFDESNGLLVGVLAGTVPFTIDPITAARADTTVTLPSE